MANNTRAWPNISTRMTVVRPARAPSETRLAARLRPLALSALAIGAASFSSV
jgi:hypothetical protein